MLSPATFSNLVHWIYDTIINYKNVYVSKIIILFKYLVINHIHKEKKIKHYFTHVLLMCIITKKN